jgi:membrane protein YqaA with SNARE-associated domain
MDFILLIQQYGLIGVFLNTFLSGSIVPYPSEPAIVLGIKLWDPLVVFVVSLAGTVIGAWTNWIIGRYGIRNYLVRRSPEQEAKARKWFNRWGSLLIFFSPWIPIVGDPALIVAGALRVPQERFLLLVLVGNAIKVAITIWIGTVFLQLIGWL